MKRFSLKLSGRIFQRVPRLKGKSLFIQTLLGFSVASLMVLGLFTLLLSWGISSSVKGWNESVNASIRRDTRDLLENLYRSKGLLTTVDIEQAVALLINPNIYLYVEDALGNLLYLYRQGEQIRPGSDPGQGKNFLRRHGNTITLETLDIEGKIVARFAAGTFGFNASESNARFLSTLTQTLWIGLGMSLVISLAIAYGFSRILARQGRIVAQGLIAIKAGKRDVTFPAGLVEELHTIAQTAQQLQERLTREEDLRKQWTADIAHDLRTPLSSLRGQLEGILDGVLPVSNERLSHLYHEVLRLQQLVQDLAELSRIEAPEFKPQYQTIHCESLFSEILSRFGIPAREKGFTLTGKWDIPSFEGDEKLLLRALSNLVHNALLYGTPGPIQLFFTKEKEGISISVCNQGTIPEDHIPYLFQRSYRADAARRTEGSGLGLAIVKAVAQAHGGTVEFKNTPQGTSVFTFYLHTKNTESP